MRRLHTRGEYAADGPQRRHQVREEAGHRCIRCHHPFETGTHGKGEWTPCDEQCTHGGPVRLNTAAHTGRVEAQWRILTVHSLRWGQVERRMVEHTRSVPTLSPKHPMQSRSRYLSMLVFKSVEACYAAHSVLS
jgi:hypothetical protein